MTQITLQKEISILLEKAFDPKFYDFYNDFAFYLGNDEVSVLFSGYFTHNRAGKIKKMFDRKNETKCKTIWAQ